jgi:hypothetical protein
VKNLLYNPCPFCGGTSINPLPVEHGIELTCTSCSASIYEESGDVIKAATKWNNRVKNITTHDTQDVCDLCYDKVGYYDVTKQVFQWLIDNDYIIGKRNI